jgi:hypothetical protein
VATIDVEVMLDRTGVLGALLSRGIVGSEIVEFIEEVKLLGVSHHALPVNRMLPAPVESL